MTCVWFTGTGDGDAFDDVEDGGDNGDYGDDNSVISALYRPALVPLRRARARSSMKRARSSISRRKRPSASSTTDSVLT